MIINPVCSISLLLIDDDETVTRVLTSYMERCGMACRTARTAAQAMAEVAANPPSVVLVDLGLPDAHGVDLVSWLAQRGDCGIIVVSGAGAEADRIVGIELGADDYVVKPPSLRELVARIRAVHRRRLQGTPADAPPASAREHVDLGDCAVCIETAAVRDAAGEPVHLTGAERKVLELLLAAGREPVSKAALCAGALRRPLGAEDRAIDQIILALRRKLGAGGREAIVSVRGAGYVLAPSPPPSIAPAARPSAPPAVRAA
jgi:DNA-binding response OmpR family regulator